MTPSDRSYRGHPSAEPATGTTPAADKTGRTRQRRADALRSNDAILDAALAIVRAEQDLNMAAIARAAGVSRVTLYSHYATKELLVEAVVRRAVASAAPLIEQAAQGQEEPVESLTKLLRSSWEVLASYRNLHAVAAGCLPPAALHDAHAPLFEPLGRLIARGQSAGTLRADLPVDWLIATMLTLLHLASEQVETGRLQPDEAGAVATATILSAFTDTSAARATRSP